MSDQLEFVESPIYHSSTDDIAYTLDTTDYGGSPTNVSVIATNLSTGQVVTSQVLNGSASVSGDDITTPKIRSTLKGNEYAVDITFTCSSNTFKRRLRVICQF